MLSLFRCSRFPIYVWAPVNHRGNAFLDYSVRLLASLCSPPSDITTSFVISALFRGSAAACAAHCYPDLRSDILQTLLALRASSGARVGQGRVYPARTELAQATSTSRVVVQVCQGDGPLAAIPGEGLLAPQVQQNVTNGCPTYRV